MSRQIVGISLVRNEDLFITQVISNVAAFCDKIIILDNISTDNTGEKINRLKESFSHIETHRINDYRQSHQYISEYAGSDTWVLGVDGDEIYDPTGLESLRAQLLEGHFDKHWAINCAQLDLNKNLAKGYPSPPSRSMTKLFNFSALVSWHGSCERFHGGEKRFHPGFDETQRLSLQEQFCWNESPFRCLHLCFIKRSTNEKNGPMSRLQPGEKPKWLQCLDRLGVGCLFDGAIQTGRSVWKDEKYRRGELQTIDTAPFFPRPCVAPDGHLN
jgi:glycosyltransferase involved in cell wall biosynthesis